MSPLLQVEHLSVTYRKRDFTLQAVKDISFSLYKGKTLALVGESGSGKSTTAQALLPLLPKPSYCHIEGKVLYKGKEILTAKKSSCPCISYVFQDPLQALNPTMRIGKQITETLRLHQKMSSNEAIDFAHHLLELCDLLPSSLRFSQYPHEMSGGMRQRVVIAIALAMNKDLLIADEPTASLDVTTEAQILDLLMALQKKTQCALLFISHDLAVVSKISDQICVMKEGKIVEVGKTQELLINPKHPYTQLLVRAQAYPQPQTSLPSPLCNNPEQNCFSLSNEEGGFL